MTLEMIPLERTPAAPRAALWSLLRLSAAFLAALAFSCSGGEESTGKSGKKRSKAKVEEETTAGADIEELQATAQDLLAKARKAGLAASLAEDLESAAEQIQAAEDLLDEGNETKAKSKLNLATRRLKSLLEEKEKVAEAVKKLGDVRKGAEEAKKKAEEAKAKENAQDFYTQASEAYAGALAALEKAADVRSVDGARQGLVKAKEIFEQAALIAAENASFRERALQEKEALAGWKAKAKERGAEEKAMSEWISAAQMERDAEGLLAAGEFRQAVEVFKDAAKRYTHALQAVTDAETFKKMADDAAKRDAEWAKQQAEIARAQAEAVASPMEEEGEPEEEGVKPPPGPIVIPPPPAVAEEGVEPVTLFEGYEASKYPQELDAEDEAFLQLNYKKLLKSGSIEYDPTTGGAMLNYAVGKDVQADHVQVYPIPKDFISFKDPMMDTKRLSEEDKKKMAPFSFSGNTRGFVTFPVPFRYYVRVEWDMIIMTMDKAGTFGCVLNYDQQKKTGYATEWLKLGTLKSLVPQIRKPVGRDPYDQAADRWFDKKRPVPMVAEYKSVADTKTPDAQGTKSGIFKCVYDSGGDEEIANAMAASAYKAGYVGFQWNRTKFQVRDLRVTGVLDKKAAVAMLRKKLGIKKEGTAAAGEGGESEDKKAGDKKPKARKAAPKKTAEDAPVETPEEPAEGASEKKPAGEAEEAPAAGDGDEAAEEPAEGEEEGAKEAPAEPTQDKKKTTKSAKKPFTW